MQDEITEVTFAPEELAKLAKARGFAIAEIDRKFFVDVKNSDLSWEMNNLLEFQNIERKSLSGDLYSHFTEHSLYSEYVIKEFGFDRITTDESTEFSQKQKQVLDFLLQKQFTFCFRAKVGLVVTIDKAIIKRQIRIKRKQLEKE